MIMGVRWSVGAPLSSSHHDTQVVVVFDIVNPVTWSGVQQRLSDSRNQEALRVPLQFQQHGVPSLHRTGHSSTPADKAIATMPTIDN